MLTKPEILRRDIVSRKSFPKKQMFRLVRLNDVLILDEDYKLNGRGLYVLKDQATIDTLLKNKKLSSRYRLSIEVIQRMKECLERK